MPAVTAVTAMIATPTTSLSTATPVFRPPPSLTTVTHTVTPPAAIRNDGYFCPSALWAYHASKTPDQLGLPEICPWARATLPFDGLCSHAAFDEGVNFGHDEHDSTGMTEHDIRELEASAEERRQAYLKRHREHNSGFRNRYLAKEDFVLKHTVSEPKVTPPQSCCRSCVAYATPLQPSSHGRHVPESVRRSMVLFLRAGIVNGIVCILTTSYMHNTATVCTGQMVVAE
ncbi:hypothetical protein B0H65DRAFT_341324 [Neurospora tetraspora]|uniref:Uncharacterized protein n=1 Tax=Neurospora tetraspora TaxID=94610 RepID=A0AAE0J1A0_9PEZI|nr:hypothetical protein B0H65DRAFT_341324 [Neurospora tetraspora]